MLFFANRADQLPSANKYILFWPLFHSRVSNPQPQATVSCVAYSGVSTIRASTKPTHPERKCFCQANAGNWLSTASAELSSELSASDMSRCWCELLVRTRSYVSLRFSLLRFLPFVRQHWLEQREGWSMRLSQPNSSIFCCFFFIYLLNGAQSIKTRSREGRKILNHKKSLL